MAAVALAWVAGLALVAGLGWAVAAGEPCAGEGPADGMAVCDSLCMGAEFLGGTGGIRRLDLPTPTPNWRCTRAQNASRSHSRASW